METFIFLAILLVALSGLTVNLLVAYMLWQHWHDKQAVPAQPVTPEETPEEKEARRLAAKAQAAYEQGFVNLMSFDGMPPKGE